MQLGAPFGDEIPHLVAIFCNFNGYLEPNWGQGNEGAVRVRIFPMLIILSHTHRFMRRQSTLWHLGCNDCHPDLALEALGTSSFKLERASTVN